VETYDPLVPQFAAHPPGRFDLVVAFEVLEHTPDPPTTLAEMDQFMDHNGMIFFSTGVLGPEFEQSGIQWWYVGPRNGHVSIYSP